jgi:uncharacterized Zn finger protein (UPF0148 family)
MPLSPGDIARAARRLEVAAHAEFERAVRRLREDGRGWRAIAVLLGLDQVTGIVDPAVMAFDYCAGLPTAPTFALPRVCWDCPSCGQTVVDLGPTVCPAQESAQRAAAAEARAGDARDETARVRQDAARERDELRAALEARAQALDEVVAQLRARAERAERDLDAARATESDLRADLARERRRRDQV